MCAEGDVRKHLSMAFQYSWTDLAGSGKWLCFLEHHRRRSDAYSSTWILCTKAGKRGSASQLGGSFVLIFKEIRGLFLILCQINFVWNAPLLCPFLPGENGKICRQTGFILIWIIGV
jgi:hypothetical protein